MNALETMLKQAEALVRSRPLTAALTAAGLSTLFYIVHDIRTYIALGPHGLPDNFWGWYRQLRMTPMSRKDTTTPLPADVDIDAIAAKYPPQGRESFLSPALESRLGNRPDICKFVAPQRQYNERASDAFKRDMFTYLGELAALNPGVLKMGDSCLEGPVPAVQLHPEVKGPDMLYLSFTRERVAEILHVHPPDGSTHLELSLEDSRILIERGWGQRHRLAGSMMPFGYTLLYAPRNRAEMEVWRDVIAAAVKFCTAGIGEIRFPQK